MRDQRRSSSPILSPPVLIVLIPIATFVFLFVAVPPAVSFASNVFRPLAFRNGWDFLNILLVLFAVLCGVFANRNDDATAAGDALATEATAAVSVAADGTESGSDNPQRWFGYSEGYPGVRPAENIRRLRRSSSSYPDLRHDSLWSERDELQRNQVRFFDDFEVHKHRQTTPFHSPPRRDRNPEEEAKVIPVDSFVPRTPTADNTPPPGTPPPPPPPPSKHRKPRRSYQAAGRREKRAEEHGSAESEAKAVLSPPPPTPPPPPPRPPPSPARIRTEPKKLERRKSNVKKEIATALASLYNQRKRKRKQKITTITSGASSSVDLDSAPQPPPVPQHFSGIPPPPPPPPPPSSVFNSLFKKGTTKTKRIHSVPPAPLPPTPSSKYEIRSKPSPPRSRQKPPLPAKPKSYDDNASSGGQSPLIPIPPPPPPPFKVAEWRFDVRGDFARILSAQSSRCGSPELDDADSSSAKVGPDVVNAMDGGDGARAGLVFCPSPDVNLKADNFIARLYDGWRLEKIKSLRENRKM